MALLKLIREAELDEDHSAWLDTGQTGTYDTFEQFINRVERYINSTRFAVICWNQCELQGADGKI